MRSKSKRILHTMITIALPILVLLAGRIIYLDQHPAVISNNIIYVKGPSRIKLAEEIQQIKNSRQYQTEEVTEGKLQGETLLTIHFIDVGQADAILLQSDGHNMLIDAGNNADNETVVRYLKEQGAGVLDYCIATHCHEDHIGAMDQVIINFPINVMFMIGQGQPTKTYNDVLNTIERKAVKVKKPIVGATYELGEAVFTILAPNGEYESNMNNWSIGVKVTCGVNTFLFCGDMESEAEEDLIQNGYDITADVLKVSHHGSNSSTSKKFLKAVNPDIAVISVGNGNLFGHPSDKVLKRLLKARVKVYRTDRQGTIVIRSDGMNLDVTTGIGE